MNFRISALHLEQLVPFLALSETELAAVGAKRVVVTESPGFPCRITLQDAPIGETVLLLSFTHQAAASLYRSSGAIFVREGAAQAMPGVNEVPDSIRTAYCLCVPTTTRGCCWMRMWFRVRSWKSPSRNSRR